MLSKSQSLLLALALLVGVAISALPTLIQFPQPSADEARFAIPTMDFIFTHHRPPLFLYANSYVAPVQETIAAIPFRLSGNNINVFRFFGILFSALAAFLWLKFLTPIYGQPIAITCSLLFALPSPMIATMRTAWMEYSFGCLLVPLLLLIAYKTNLARPFLLGLTAGLAHYCFPMIAPVVALIGLLVLVRPYVEAASLPVRRHQAALVLASLPFLFAVFYWQFSRSEPWPRRIIVLGMIGAVPLLIAAVSFTVQNFKDRLTHTAVTSFALYSAGFLLILGVVQFIWHAYERPYFESIGVTLWEGNKYVLKPWPNWPYQVSIAANRTLPATLAPVPVREQITLYEDRKPYWSSLFLFSLSLAFVATFTSFRLFSKSNLTMGTLWKLITPAAALLMLVLMVPSWRLNNDYCIRYLMLFLPGFYLLALGNIHHKTLLYSLAAILTALNMLGYALSNVPAFLQPAQSTNPLKANRSHPLPPLPSEPPHRAPALPDPSTIPVATD